MDEFEQFVNYRKYPVWDRVPIGLLVLKLRNLSNKIQKWRWSHQTKQTISKQNKLLSYTNGLGISVRSSDTVLLKRLKSMGWDTGTNTWRLLLIFNTNPFLSTIYYEFKIPSIDVNS